MYHFTLVHIKGVPAYKKRRLAVPLPLLPPQQDHNWISSFNLEGRILMSQHEVGDGATSHVYVGTLLLLLSSLSCTLPNWHQH